MAIKWALLLLLGMLMVRLQTRNIQTREITEEQKQFETKMEQEKKY